MKTVLKSLTMMIVLALTSSAWARKIESQAAYESLFSCIKKLVPSRFRLEYRGTDQDFQLAKSYLQALTVAGHSPQIVQSLSQYCQQKKEVPTEITALVDTEQNNKITLLLYDFLTPKFKCTKGGIELAGAIYIALSIKLQIAKCNSTIGESWYQFMPGGGIGVGLGSALTISGGQHERYGDSASDDTGDAGFRIVAGLGLAGNLSVSGSKAEYSSEMRSVTQYPFTSGGIGVGTAAMVLGEGQLAMTIRRLPLRADYLLHRLGIDYFARKQAPFSLD